MTHIMRMGLVLPLLLAGLVPGSASGQVAVEALRTRDGLVLDLPADGAWRRRARAVADVRAALRAALDVGGLNAALGGGGGRAGSSMDGTMYVPALMIGYANTDTARLPRAASYDSLYFGLTPPAGRAYSLRTLYREMSNDLLDVQGAALGWHLGDSAQSYYLGACGSANAIDCSLGRSRINALVRAALTAADAGTDFGQFDNDGPDGVPNSGDDDGTVDVLQLVQPVVGGECGGPGVWAHRWYLSSLGGSDFATADPRAGGGVIRVNSYFIASGVGGAGPGNRNGCSQPTSISGVGTTAHEFGHALGLPDLYDTGGGTQGIGEWGLMGSGGYTSANSPTHLEAWSKEQLGWVTVVPVSSGVSRELRPVVGADTVLLVRPPAGTVNPRGEYFLLENRQPVLADTANMLFGGNAGPKVGGLLIWHIDSAKVAQSRFANTVNYGVVHGVALEQADGDGDLDATSGGNRGDAGDPFPGANGNRAFDYATVPAATKNGDGQYVGFSIDSIRQVTPAGNVGFRIRFGMPLLTAVQGPGAIRTTSGTPPDTLFTPGDVVTLAAVPDTTALFDSWSGDTTTLNDTLALTMTRAWSVTATFVERLAASPPAPGAAVMGASYAATLSAGGGTGTYTWTLVGGTLPPGLVLRETGTLGGVPEQTGSFAATVRVTSGRQSNDLQLNVTVTAPVLTTASVLGALIGSTAALTADERRYLDLLGNRNGSFDVGDFHAFIDKTGGAASASMIADALKEEGRR